METDTTLEKIGHMEERYEAQIDLLRFQIDDVSNMTETLIGENEVLKVDLKELREWRKVHYALYFFLFVYGMVYGAYLKREQQEL